jgi:hypothetical protein
MHWAYYAAGFTQDKQACTLWRAMSTRHVQLLISIQTATSAVDLMLATSTRAGNSCWEDASQMCSTAVFGDARKR